jgi:5,6-dimethylbenzimidazole synthase
MSMPSYEETGRDSPVSFDFRSEQFRLDLRNLFVWRRDERHFRSDPLPVGAIRELVETACLAPSVGNAQPWRFVDVQCAKRRAQVAEIFERENQIASQIYSGEQRKSYAALKLDGLREAPTHLAVFCDDASSAGSGLGRQSMPEMLRYSVVCAIHTLWLAAHARGLGVGWVSILEPSDVRRILDVPNEWTLIAYLCIGWPKERHRVPELERRGWQDRLKADLLFFTR